MIKSFYHEDFAIVIKFDEWGDLTGILKGTNPRTPIHEFNGIYVNKENGVDFYFALEWSLPVSDLYAAARGSSFESVFTGVIEDDVMHLNWLHLLIGEYESSGSATLSSSFTGRNFAGRATVGTPFPVHVLLNASDN